MTLAPTAFSLPDHLSAKADPALVTDDERHFAAIAASLRTTIDELTVRLEAERRRGGSHGQAAMDRDLEVHRLTARLRTLRRFSLDLCLGRIVHDDDPEPVYIGRLGLTDADGNRLLVDWRSPAAEPFFAATHAQPMGLASRRRYRWTRGRISDYWDEVFTPEGLSHHAALDDQSAFIASLGASRSPRMRDVLGTIQSDQDAIIRASSRGALVVDGGPGTGKTVVALHRAAYLLYEDPRLGSGRGGVLFIGPHQPYLAYVADVLPSLGEDGVRTCTLRDLVPGGHDLVPEDDPTLAALKADARMVAAIEPAAALYEEPPTAGVDVETDVGDLWVGRTEWAEAFGAVEPGTPHNEGREQVVDALVEILAAKYDDEESLSPELIRRGVLRSTALQDSLGRAWPLLDPAELVGDLWEVPAYLRRCAPWLDEEQVRLLRRPAPQRWTESDLPLLDAAHRRLGDPEASRRRQRAAAEQSAEKEEMDRVVDHLIADDDSEMMLMSMLRGADLQGALTGPATGATPDALAGPFAHVVVDEAQELTAAEWQMLVARCPSRSFTIVGDRAQARHGFTESWEERLARAGIDRVAIASLTVNYRTPEEVMAEAAPVIRAVLPDANVPTSVRSTGLPVRHLPRAERDAVLADWRERHPEGIACVIGDPTFVASDRVRSLAPELTKGLEFDLVVLVEPEAFGDGIEGAVDHYVAMTRATQELVVLSDAT